MATLSRLTVGQVLYSVTSQRMGNTTIRRKAVHPVKVISIDLEKGTMQASWNGNPPRTYYAKNIKALKVKEPVIKGRGLLG